MCVVITPCKHSTITHARVLLHYFTTEAAASLFSSYGNFFLLATRNHILSSVQSVQWKWMLPCLSLQPVGCNAHAHTRFHRRQVRFSKIDLHLYTDETFHRGEPRIVQKNSNAEFSELSRENVCFFEPRDHHKVRSTQYAGVSRFLYSISVRTGFLKNEKLRSTTGTFLLNVLVLCLD